MIVFINRIENKNVKKNIDVTTKRYHNQVRIVEGERYKMSLVLDQQLYHMVYMEITDVVTNDQGEYRVIAKNTHGEGAATLNLNFEGSSKK